MIETDFMKLYEKLNILNEKWYNDAEIWGGRLWFSDSAIEFKNFMQNLSSSGLKGVRLCIAPDYYLAANAEDFQHDTMIEAARDILYITPPDNIEYTTCGIPSCIDFELGNFEIELYRQYALDDPNDETPTKYLNYDAAKDYIGTLVADYGTFELSLYSFKSKACPEYKSDREHATYFEDSEIYRVLKPLLKRIYIYGKE
jgi:hypothetical protein